LFACLRHHFCDIGGVSCGGFRSQSRGFSLSAAGERIAGPQPKVPPDCGTSTALTTILQGVIVQRSENSIRGLESMKSVAGHMALAFNPPNIRQPLDRFWRDLKGVTAVVIASI
jgi:hypothetical protein